MAKYIDADKLKARIEEWYNIYKIGQHSPFRNGKVETLRETIELIDSLQQEQPHKSFCEENCKGYRDTGGKCFFGFNCSAKKAQEWSETGLEVSKFCQPVPKNIANCVAEHFWEMLDDEEKENTTAQQEQPEVELEKEIDHFWDSCIKHKNERGGNVIWSNKIEIEVLARHFYELGLNARKEK